MWTLVVKIHKMSHLCRSNQNDLLFVGAKILPISSHNMEPTNILVGPQYALWPGYNRYKVRARKNFQPRICVDKTKSKIGVGISVCNVFVLISWSQNTELISATSLPVAFCLLGPGRPLPENYGIIRFEILFASTPELNGVTHWLGAQNTCNIIRLQINHSRKFVSSFKNYTYASYATYASK